jgi:nitroreductase
VSFFDVALAQRACRSYASDPVPEADVDRMIEATTHAPSADNSQPWIFVVVRDEDRRRAIGDLSAGLWTAAGRAFAEESLEPRMFAEADSFFTNGYGGAPVLIVVAGDLRAGASRSAVASSIYPAVQNLLLAAAALGYGSAMTTLATYAADELATVVELPEKVVPMAVVPVGKPARPLGPPRRRPVDEVAHAETFGHPFGDAN